MPPQTTQSHKQTPFSNGDQLDFHRSQLERLEDIGRAVDEAYAPAEELSPQQRGDMTPLGATATQYKGESAADHAISYEMIELTLEQLGKNIERMRADAMGKTVNPAPTPNEFISRTPATIPSSTIRPVSSVNLDTGYRTSPQADSTDYQKVA